MNKEEKHLYNKQKYEKYKEKQCLYREKNREKIRLYGNEYYKKHREERRLYKKKEYEKTKNDLILKEKQKLYRDKPENILRSKERRKKYKDRISVYSKKYYDKNKFFLFYKEKRRLRNIKYLINLWLNAFNILGGFKCSNLNCIHPTGDIQPKLFEIDHINGGGSIEFKKGLNVRSKYSWIINNLEIAKLKYQVLCVACNRIKKEEDNECRNKSGKISEIKIAHDHAIIALGGRCTDPNCVFSSGCTNIRILDIHHINMNGSKERKEIGDYMIYRKIVKNPEKAKFEYQVLCVYCHGHVHIKQKEDNEFNKKFIVNFILSN